MGLKADAKTYPFHVVKLPGEMPWLWHIVYPQGGQTTACLREFHGPCEDRRESKNIRQLGCPRCVEKLDLMITFYNKLGGC